jgi:hypothetical protein
MTHPALTGNPLAMAALEANCALHDAIEQRDASIVALVQSGVSQRAVAEFINMSHVGVGKIVARRTRATAA